MQIKTLPTVLFKDIDKKQFWLNLKTLLVISLFSAFLIIIDGGFFGPLLFGLFIVYQFYGTKKRFKYLPYVLPLIFFVIFITSGGSFFLMFPNSGFIFQLITGIWASFTVLLSIWLLFKVKLKVVHFVLLAFTIPIAYLVREYIFKGMSENTEFFFFFIYNACLSFSLCLLLTQNNDEIKRKREINLNFFTNRLTNSLYKQQNLKK